MLSYMFLMSLFIHSFNGYGKCANELFDNIFVADFRFRALINYKKFGHPAQQQ